MRKMFNFWLYGMVHACVLLLMTGEGHAQERAQKLQEALRANSSCLECHGQLNYSYFNDWTEMRVVKSMNPAHIVDSASYYTSKHGTFKCLDCHSPEYIEFPHNKELRMEPVSNCLDCHVGDESTRHYNFEVLQEEHQKSVHAQKFSDRFDCRACHDIHHFQTHTRNGGEVRQIVAHSNLICMNCHNNKQNFSKWSASDFSRIAATHDWLPQQELHFQAVRCIECHSRKDERVLIPHNVLPKEEAVRSCEACHSETTRMSPNLYGSKLEGQEGFPTVVNPKLDKLYVIGTPRHSYMKWGRVILLSLIACAISIHLVKRILKMK